MEKENIVFVNQLILKLEENVNKLEAAKKDNDPRTFNKIKKDCFELYEEIGKLLQ